MRPTDGEYLRCQVAEKGVSRRPGLPRSVCNSWFCCGPFPAHSSGGPTLGRPCSRSQFRGGLATGGTAVKHELMRPELDANTFIRGDYWDSGRKGLLAGENLHFDLKRLEVAYLEHNKCEDILTKQVSIRRLDPLALLTLQATGSCEVTIPEWLHILKQINRPDLDDSGVRFWHSRGLQSRRQRVCCLRQC
jgi:receptor-binding and translocation channel-forming TcA subunit of Tc toxin